MIKYEVKVYNDGNKYWYLNGKSHREDGPAIEYANGDKKWYLDDTLHREDGPAMEFASGGKAWYLNGEKLTEEEHHIRTLPTVKTASSKPMFEVSEIRENSHDDSATLVIDMSPEMVQIVLTKGVNAILRDMLDEIEGGQDE